jgi:hypothetical protein
MKTTIPLITLAIAMLATQTMAQDSHGVGQ